MRPDAAGQDLPDAPRSPFGPRGGPRDLGLPVEEVARAIDERDRRDAAQMPPAPDAHVLDTGGLDADEVTAQVLALVRAVTA